jgi:poly(3-hydroxybutyrate) depolymerase
VSFQTNFAGEPSTNQHKHSAISTLLKRQNVRWRKMSLQFSTHTALPFTRKFLDRRNNMETLYVSLIVVIALAALMASVVRMIASRLDRTDRELKERLKIASLVSAKLERGRWHWKYVEVQGIRRLFGLYCPSNFNPERKTTLWIGADGVTLFRREGNMAGVNGLQEAAEERGHLLAIVYPERTRHLGIVSGWNMPNGFLRFKRKWSNDVIYVREVITALRNGIRLDDVALVGFSAGATLFHAVASEVEEGAVQLVVSVCGTVIGRKQPRKGIALLSVHGNDDPRLPLEGGTGRSKITLMLVALGHTGILRSAPKQEVRLYALANGLNYPSIWQSDSQMYTITKEYSAPTQTPVVQLLLLREYGGHSFPNRKVGGKNESALSKKHGQPIPRDKFDFFGKVDTLAARANQRAAM